MNFNDFIVTRKIKLKLTIFVCFLFVFTGSDLFVKYQVEKNLRNIPEKIESYQFEYYFMKSDDNEIIKKSYEKMDDGSYHLVEKDSRKLHLLWKEIRKFGFDKEIKVIDGLWSFIYVTNEDIGFSILSFLDNIMKPDTKKNFLIFLQGSGVLIIFIYYVLTKDFYQFIPLAMIVTGALGNVIDRITRGYVVDFIMWTFKFIPHRLFNPWPIFNLSDSYTVVGAITLFVLIFIFDSKKDNNIR